MNWSIILFHPGLIKKLRGGDNIHLYVSIVITKQQVRLVSIDICNQDTVKRNNISVHIVHVFSKPKERNGHMKIQLTIKKYKLIENMN